MSVGVGVALAGEPQVRSVDALIKMLDGNIAEIREARSETSDGDRQEESKFSASGLQ